MAPKHDSYEVPNSHEISPAPSDHQGNGFNNSNLVCEQKGGCIDCSIKYNPSFQQHCIFAQPNASEQLLDFCRYNVHQTPTEGTSKHAPNEIRHKRLQIGECECLRGQYLVSPSEKSLGSPSSILDKKPEKLDKGKDQHNLQHENSNEDLEAYCARDKMLRMSLYKAKE